MLYLDELDDDTFFAIVKSGPKYAGLLIERTD